MADGTACQIGMFAELLLTGTRRGAIIGLMTDIRALRTTSPTAARAGC